MSVLTMLEGPTFETERFCPYHGDWVLLGDCKIVATNLIWTARYLTAQASNGGQVVTPDAFDDDADAEPARVANDSNGAHREMLTSRVDNQKRLIVAEPPKRPATPERKRFRSAPVAPELPSPAELARDKGGARARPARLCPECLHPLPASSETREIYSITLVGHTGASKTTTVAALSEQLRALGPEAVGVPEFSPTEATAKEMAAVLHRFRQGHETKGTQAKEFHPPLEFLTVLNGDPATVLLHDVAGEDLMEPDTRLVWAPYVLWADAVVFIYNPEESPALGIRTSAPDGKPLLHQAAMLNGVRDDFESRPDADMPMPPLIVAVSKADLLSTGARQAGEAEVHQVLHELGDGEVVTAGQRWETTEWCLIAPQPPSGDPVGVTKLFQRTLDLISTR